ncbi:MAG: UbiX family flavin prenyltransferase [Rhizomicrobium sp.]|nr:UbiX family flavin prenyltransferase [Rhizomicrobium sp.]
MGKNQTNTAVKERLVVGISGASGVVYGVRLLDALRDVGVESHLVISKAAQLTLGLETKLSLKSVLAKADFHYAAGDVAASIASGSFTVKGMVVAPCSVRSMSEIATGVTTTLLTRAADVNLKERRRLVLAVRETPLHLGHLRTMTALTEMGAMILPPVPAFYAAPDSLEDLVDHFVGRILDCFGYNWTKAKRWDGPVQKSKAKP